MRDVERNELCHPLYLQPWGYEVSILEFTAAVASFIGVYLGTTGNESHGLGGF
jgi:hypothetical protein